MKKLALLGSNKGHVLEAMKKYFEGKDVEITCVSDAEHSDFFQKAAQFGFIRADDPLKQTELIVSLMLGLRHYRVLLGLDEVPTASEIDQMIQQAIELFLLKYQPKN